MPAWAAPAKLRDVSGSEFDTAGSAGIAAWTIDPLEAPVTHQNNQLQGQHAAAL